MINVRLTYCVYYTIFISTVIVFKILWQVYTKYHIHSFVSGMCLNKPYNGSDECKPLIEKAACWVCVFGSSEKPWENKSCLPLMQFVCVWQSTPDPSQILSVQKWTQQTHPQRLCCLFSLSIYVCMLLKTKSLSSFTHWTTPLVFHGRKTVIGVWHDG